MWNWCVAACLLPIGLKAQVLTPQDTVPLLERVVSIESATSDLQALERWILNTHPAALTDDSLLIIGAVRRATHQLQHPQSNWMFAHAVAGVLAALNDSHTGLDWRILTQEIEATWGRFPEAVTLDGGQIHTTTTGVRIDSVNHWTARAVLENARNTCSSEGGVRPSHYRRATALWPWIAAIPGPGVQAGEGVAWTASGAAIPMLPPTPRSAALRPSRKSGVKAHFTGPIATLTIPSFSQGSPAHFHRQINRFFRKGRRKKVEGMVIDVRGNTGGLASRMESVAEHLISEPERLMQQLDYRNTVHAREAFAPAFDAARHRQRERWARRDRWAAWRMEVDTLPEGAIWQGTLRDLQPNRNSFSGPVAVLVDGSTASTAAHFAMWVDLAPHRTAVGEPALTSLHGTCAHAASWSLPSSGLPIRCSTMRVWVTTGASWNNGQWMPGTVCPHLRAPETAMEWLQSH